MLADSREEQGHRLTLNSVRDWEAGTKLYRWLMPWKNVCGLWTMWSWSATSLTGRKERAVCVAEVHRASLGPGGGLLHDCMGAGDSKAASPSTALSQLSSYCSQYLPAPSRHCWATAANQKKILLRTNEMLPVGKHRLSIRKKPVKTHITH